MAKLDNWRRLFSEKAEFRRIRKNGLLKDLTEEQIAKAKECQSPEELLNFAKEEGIELSEEQLEAVSGGGCFENSEPVICPKCGSVNDYICIRNVGNGPAEKTCNQCGYSGLFW